MLKLTESLNQMLGIEVHYYTLAGADGDDIWQAAFDGVMAGVDEELIDGVLQMLFLLRQNDIAQQRFGIDNTWTLYDEMIRFEILQAHHEGLPNPVKLAQPCYNVPAYGYWPTCLDN